MNYADHAAESNMDVPKKPNTFNKWTSAIYDPNDDAAYRAKDVETAVALMATHLTQASDEAAGYLKDHFEQ